MNRLRVVLLLVGIAFGPCLSDRVLAQDAAEPQDTEDLRRKTPSGQYIDPASFFRFHGYVTLTYAEPQAEFGSEIGGSPHRSSSAAVLLVQGRMKAGSKTTAPSSSVAKALEAWSNFTSSATPSKTTTPTSQTWWATFGP